MFAAITSIFSIINTIVWIIKQVMAIWKSVDAAKAAEKRKQLDEAMDKLQNATTPEQQKEAIREVARNSF